MIDAERATATVTNICRLLIAAQYEDVVELSQSTRLSAADLARAVSEYGRRLSLPPSGVFEPRDAVEVRGAKPPRWAVYVDLWTEDGGRSDLTLELTLIETTGALYAFEIDDLHTL